ncbi:sigma-54-dependent transcriptional regulator [Membranihabitans maritimus]|uniref:sigma-54-dependent transcriptional regulator n=1 Tax=Membranihabitans maritimus TaxID=2904244 RepID=UPI001F172759|nr:sigma-54 dependent transcriptional regulator [Membranihabitans maritimus]
MDPKILIIDDDRTVCQSLKLLFSKAGFQVQSIYNPHNVLEFINSFHPDIVLLDLNFSVDTSGSQGLKILESLRPRHPDLPILLITAWGTLELAVKGMKLGAKDFITKPWDNRHLLSAVNTQIELNSSLKKEISDFSSLDAIIGRSKVIKDVKSMILQIASTNATVLVTGESGTGKELVAEAIHDNSQRNENPFVKVNLGGIPDELFESELFGHVKGAFTGAVSDRTGRFKVADRGTIFLDEVGELSRRTQVKLLRVLQEKTFEPLGSNKTIKSDVRVISATHRNLETMVIEGQFREDLFYRLNLLQIHLPALSERREDIPLLVHSFIQRLNQTQGDKHIEAGASALEWLSLQEFPGNIRQLKNIVERAWLLSRKTILERGDFKQHFSDQKPEQGKLPKVGSMTLEEMEVTMIQRAMYFHNGNISQVARSLGITRSALYRRLSKYNISHEY